MSRRPLVFVLGLTVGDYFLWMWSLNSNHAVLALISGLTFPPLALGLLWLLALAAAKLLARTALRPAVRRHAAPRVGGARATRPPRSATAAPRPPSAAQRPAQAAQRPAADAARQGGSAAGAPSRKIAA